MLVDAVLVASKSDVANSSSSTGSFPVAASMGAGSSAGGMLDSAIVTRRRVSVRLVLVKSSRVVLQSERCMVIEASCNVEVLQSEHQRSRCSLARGKHDVWSGEEHVSGLGCGQGVMSGVRDGQIWPCGIIGATRVLAILLPVVRQELPPSQLLDGAECNGCRMEIRLCRTKQAC
jgi:hypothetical protein